MNIDFERSINVFTDASIIIINGTSVSCSGYAIVCNGQITEAKFRILYDSSNNFGEIYALFMGIKAAILAASDNRCRINIISDSQISVFGLRDWIFAWYKRLNKESMMISTSKKPIAYQCIYKRIVKAIVTSGLPVNIYHQLGHMSNTEQGLKKVIDRFGKVNMETIDENVASKIICFNNFVDRFTRDNLYSITGSSVFDIDKYKKEVEDSNEVLNEEEMSAYGRLINKTSIGDYYANDKDIGLQEKSIAHEDYEGNDDFHSELADSVQSVPDEPITSVSEPELAPSEPSLPEKETVSLAVGDMINHRKFGKGVVTAVKDRDWFDADFENVGSKTLIWGVFDMGIAQKEE